MFKAFTSQSDDVDTLDAIDEVIDDLSEQLDGQTPKAALLFCAIEFEHQIILDRIYETWPDIDLIGATSDGEISSQTGFMLDSITLTVFVSDKIEIASGVGINTQNDINKSCEEAVELTKKKLSSGPKLCITTPESLSGSGDSIVQGLKKSLGEDFPIFGGLSTDKWKFIGTKQFYNNQVLSNSIPMFLFSGPLVYSYGVEVGLSPVGEPVKVTKSIDNRVFEIDNISAKEFHIQKFGTADLPSGEIPISILNDEMKNIYLRSSVMEFNDDGSLDYLGHVPQGSYIQLCKTVRDTTIEGCDDSIKNALDNFPSSSKANVAICFSCAARQMLLGTKANLEEEKLKGHFEEMDVTYTGFYTYGEISSVEATNKTYFHNQTFVTLLLGEE